MRNKTRLVVLSYAVLLISTVFCFAATASDLDQQLQALEDIRLSEPKRFIEGINALDDQKTAFSPQQAKYYALLKGYSQALLGNYSQALAEMEALLSVNDNDIYAFRAHNLALNLYVLSKQYLKAFIELDYINHQLDVIEDATAKSQAIGNIAMLYNEIERYDIALNYAEYFLQGSELDSKAKCRIQAHRITSLFYLNNTEDFFAEADKAVALCRDTQEVIPKLIIEQVKLRAYQTQHDDSQAISLYHDLEADIQRSRYPLLIAGFNTYVAKSYLNENNLELASEHAYRALTDIANMDVSLVHVELYSLLAELEKRNGRYQQAVMYFQQLLTLQQQYADVKMRQQLAYHQAQGELEIKNQRIALLNKDNALLYLQKDVYEQEVRQTRILMTVLVLVLGIALVMAYKGIAGWRRFKKIAEFDLLTGLNNRYHFNTLAGETINSCERLRLPVAVIMFELDSFKQINDENSHAVGDWALRAVVAACRNFVRNQDVFGRVGGVEFAMVLPDCQTDKALLLAEICRDAIAAIDTEKSGCKFSLTASFGVSSADSSGYQLKQLLADADNAMYKANADGGDQVRYIADL